MTHTHDPGTDTEPPILPPNPKNTVRSLRNRKIPTKPLRHVSKTLDLVIQKRLNCSAAKRYGYHSCLWSELNNDELFSISLKAHWCRADRDKIIQDSYDEYVIHGYQLAEPDNCPLILVDIEENGEREGEGGEGGTRENQCPRVRRKWERLVGCAIGVGWR